MRPGADPRPAERIAAHYRVERELADRLRNCEDPEERRSLYAAVYDELYRRVPDHPQLLEKQAGGDDAEVRDVLGLLRARLRRARTVVEIGPGDCRTAFALAQRVERVVGVDVSAEITAAADPPPNFELVLSDGSSVPVPPGSVDLAFSNQLMEHLHPGDVARQLAQVRAALRPDGWYVCITPNRLSGPHDVSRAFDDEARGFHLHEYTAQELIELLRRAGFRRWRVALGARGRYVWLPAGPFVALERLLAALPARWRRRLGRSRPVALLLGVRMAAAA